MFCINCGSNLPEHTKFCPSCGSPVNNTDSDIMNSDTVGVWDEPSIISSFGNQSSNTSSTASDYANTSHNKGTTATYTAPPPNTAPIENTSSSALTKDLKESDLRLLSRTVSSLKTSRGFCIFGLVLFGLLVICMVEAFLFAEALVFAVLTGFFIWRTSKLSKAMRIRKVLDERIEAAKGENKFN